ncbi:retrovirus-related pol polyprotein from transposon TNT 1-94, partial [Tanacetum coccineum]
AVATACYTQNRSLIFPRHGKTPCELLHNRKPDLSYLRIYGAPCYPTNDSKDLGKIKPKADVGIFIGYAPAKKAYRIYNRCTRRIMETIHVEIDELTAMAFEQNDTLFQLLFDEYFNPPPSVDHPVSTVAAPKPVDSIGTPSLTTIDQDAPSPSTLQTPQETPSHAIPLDVEEEFHDIDAAHMDDDPFFGLTIP